MFLASHQTTSAFSARVTGDVLQGLGGYSSNKHRLVVRNGSDGDAIVKLRDADSGRSLMTFFVATSSTAAIDTIPDGEYQIQFAHGSGMTEDLHLRYTVSMEEMFARGKSTVLLSTRLKLHAWKAAGRR